MKMKAAKHQGRGAARLWAGVAFSLGLLACGAEPYHRQMFATASDGGQGGTASPSGVAGSTGIAGSTGFAGTTGAAGSPGVGGQTGGSTGTAGTTGSAGHTGAAGTTATLPDGGAAGVSGAAGAPACPGCKISVTYTCLSGAVDQAIFAIDVANQGATVVLLGDLTVRYWYTADAAKTQQLDCDDSKIGCTRLTSKFVAVTPPRTGANEYVEIVFPQGALSAMDTTGRIQLRLRNQDYTPINQTDDYSADCANNAAHANPKITAYLKGALVGGVEP
jgi:Cellulose binding domain